MIHFDIKPQNIAFSSILKKYVFLDFGLAKFI
jgi:serine/threonine protein kinase